MKFLIKLIRNETKLTLSSVLSFAVILYFLESRPSVNFTVQSLMATFTVNVIVYFAILSLVESKLNLVTKGCLAFLVLFAPFLLGFKLDYVIAITSAIIIWLYHVVVVPQIHEIEEEANCLIIINKKLDLLLAKNKNGK